MTINYNMMVSRFFLLTLIFLASCTVEDMDNEVVIFTSRQPQLIEDLLTKFTAETGIKVTVLSGNAQQLMERIVIEGSSTEADILMTVDAGVLWQAAMNNIFQPV
jgi:iron(III) transport system substrate-binding protein